MARRFLRNTADTWEYGKRELDAAQRWFDKYGQATVFFSRMIPGIRAYSSIPAGIFKMDIKKFSIYTFLGSLPWNFGLAYSGVYLGANWRAIESSYNHATTVILALLVEYYNILVVQI